MTVKQLRNILDIVDDDAEVKIFIDYYAFRDNDCFVSEAQLYALPDNNGMGVKLAVSTHETEEAK